MPCWYFEKKEIKNTPSYKDGIDSFTECRYRREGARFIIDAGTKMGLRYDTCATGVVYFHRFYMFHSFKEFHRYITAACCLFLAGKVEETPKKCKDIIKICQALLSPTLFTVFGDDPKEEVMTMERILLQTIKFDLQVDHPYSALLKFAKVVKGDKDKIQKLVQMAWTFINDSLCTTLCLQWEPEITAVSLMYLATRLTKFDIQDWNGKLPGSKMKWWEFLVEDITVDLMEDICHKVLDLYSNNPPMRDDSPPSTPSKKGGARDTPPPPPPVKRSVPSTSADNAPDNKIQKVESQKRRETSTSASNSSLENKGQTSSHSSGQQPDSAIPKTQGQSAMPSSKPTSKPEQNTLNPYMSSQMYSSSFMSQEGSKSIQSLMGGGQPPPANQAPVPVDAYSGMQGIPQPQQTQQSMGQYPAPYPTPQYPQGVYPQHGQVSVTAPYQQPQSGYGMQQTTTYHNVASQPYSAGTTMTAPSQAPQPGYPPGTYPPNYSQQPPMQPFVQQYPPPPQQQHTTGSYNQMPQQNYSQTQQMPQGQPQYQQQPITPSPRPPMNNTPRGPRMQSVGNQNPPNNTNTGLTVRISGRR